MAVAALTEMVDTRTLEDTRSRRVWVEHWKGQEIDIVWSNANQGWAEAGSPALVPSIGDAHALVLLGYVQKVKFHPRPESAAGQVLVSIVYQLLKTFA